MTPADELRAAAERLRDVTPQITGRLEGLAGPVADWLDDTASQLDAMPFPVTHTTALAVARAVLATPDSQP